LNKIRLWYFQDTFTPVARVLVIVGRIVIAALEECQRAKSRNVNSPLAGPATLS